MTDHVRETITLAVLDAVTDLATTGPNVFRDRDLDARPLQPDELPALVVVDDGEPAEIVTLGGNRLLERQMPIRITVHVKKADEYSAQINEVLKEIETALGPAAALGGAKYITLSQIEGREASEGADLPTVSQSFIFTATYYTAHGAPTAAL